MPRIRRAVLILLTCVCARLGLAQEPIPVQVAAPSYPKIAPGDEESADVQVQVSISASGDVVAARVISGPKRLSGGALLAAKSWKFQPREKPIGSWVLTFAFIYRAGMADPPLIASLFKPPDRVEVYALERKVVVIEDPPVGPVKKIRN